MLQDCQYFYFFYRSSCFVALPLTASLLGCEQTRPWGRLWGAVLWAGWTMAWAGCAARPRLPFWSEQQGRKWLHTTRAGRKRLMLGWPLLQLPVLPLGKRKNGHICFLFVCCCFFDTVKCFAPKVFLKSPTLSHKLKCDAYLKIDVILNSGRYVGKVVGGGRNQGQAEL